MQKFSESETLVNIKKDKGDSNYHLIYHKALGSYLHLIYTADITSTDETNMATFADDAGFLY